MARRFLYLTLLGAAILMIAVTSAGAHQIASNNGVSVQVHVNPDDEPVAGIATTVWVVRVKALKATFAWATCRCRMKVFDSSGTVLVDSAAKAPRIPVTFPEPHAYGITFSGRVKRSNGLWKPFKVTYAIRAASVE